jgi:hypothetical protein
VAVDDWMVTDWGGAVGTGVEWRGKHSIVIVILVRPGPIDMANTFK